MGAWATVVVGVDGSPAAANALSWTSLRSGPETSLHVVHSLAPGDELARAVSRADPLSLRSRTESHLKGVWSEPARARGLCPTLHLVDDDPEAALVRTAAETGADVIVIGPHGSGRGFNRGLGSVTRRLLRASPVPIIIVDAGDPLPRAERFVLACIGYKRASISAAEWAADYAAASKLRLVLLHVVSYRPIFPRDAPSDMLAYYLGGDVPVEWAQSELDEVRERLIARHPSLTVDTIIGKGSAPRGIESASANSELVVIGRIQKEGIGSIMISGRTRTIIGGAASPIAVIPAPAEQLESGQ